jgi:hypothetical protein
LEVGVEGGEGCDEGVGEAGADDFLWRERCSEMIEQKIDCAAFI